MSSDANIVIAGPPNQARDGLCSIFGTATFATEMPATRLLEPEPSNNAQITDLDPSKYFGLNLSSGFGTLNTRSGLAGLIDLGVRRPSIAQARQWGSPLARMRMCVSASNSAFAHYDHAAAPVSLVAVTGFTGVVGNIDEDPFAPDGNKLTWSGSGTSDAVTLGFSWGGIAPYPGEHMQAFAVRLEGVGSGTTRVELALYESGSAVVGAESRVVYVTNGQVAIVYLTWNAALLATASGANAQLRITTNSNASRGVDIRTARWYGVRGNGATPPDFDTGWVDLLETGSAYLGDDELGSVEDPTVTRAWVIPEAVRAAGWRFATFGFLIESGPVADPFTPAHLDIGAAIVAPILRPAVNFDSSGGLRVVDTSTVGATVGGQWYGARRRPRRAADLQLGSLSLEEAAALYRRLDFGSGTARPFFVSLWPDVTDPRHVLGQFYCTLKETDGIGLRPAPGKMQRRLGVIEKV